MSLVTRCPACDTTFKVVRDQLRISDGWVRCGRCSQVFDATVDLQEAPDARPVTSVPVSTPEPAPASEAPPLRAEPEPESEPEPEPEPEPAAPLEPADDDHPGMADADFFDDEQASPLAERAAFAGVVADVSWPDPDSLVLGDEGRIAVRPPAPPPLSFPDIDLTLPPRPAAPADDAAPPRPDDGGDAQMQKALRRARVKAVRIAKAKAREQGDAVADVAPMVQAASEAEPTAAPAAPRASAPVFFGVDEASSWWHRPAVRRSLFATAVLAALLLAAQVLHHERDLIAARQPALRPLLETLCRVSGCELSALRRINDIKLDGASFAREKSGDGFQLNFIVRNAAAVPLAMPAVELSLLDTQERAVVRRVLMPSEFGAPAVLPAHAERAASLSIELGGAEAASMPPVAGFRIEALYP
ncbi:zinc-ribbon and DUF3426 domain-containing protein [Variovorax sp. M-6]|uniref:zinc-ribbon and DUF3426 domain-containing protein n=1 Tax=Variovorax sp. M-6 TaxID=3233041 RepID=UPI003F947A2E